MSHCKYCGRLSYYKHGEYMEPPYSVHPIAEWCMEKHGVDYMTAMEMHFDGTY